jgi:hypothetical protein
MSGQENILVEFLVGVRDDLQLAVTDYRWFATEETSFLEEVVHSAWRDLISQFERALSELALGETLPDQLRDHGLVGPQLTLKIGFWRRQRQRARELWALMKSTARRIPSSIVHKLFDAAQIILESLSFVPGIDAIKEFKDTIESIADESDLSRANSKRSEGYDGAHSIGLSTTDLEKVRMYFDFMKDLLIGLLIGGLFGSILAGVALEYNYTTSASLWWVAYFLAATLLMILFFGFNFWLYSVEKLGKQIDDMMANVEKGKSVKGLAELLNLKKKRKEKSDGVSEN